jgi:hypothetical protein
MYDVVIVAALALGRARKRVQLCDAGPRRNAAAGGVPAGTSRQRSIATRSIAAMTRVASSG